VTRQTKLTRALAATFAIGLCLWTGRLLATAMMDPLPGMPPVVDTANLYSEAAAGRMSPVVADALPRIYVPNLRSNDVYVIDPESLKVVDRFPVGPDPQHIVPSWDLKTLWVNNNGRRGNQGSLTPIDPKTGKPGPAIPVEDPYNLYFTPDGRAAIVVAERLKQLDFRDPQEMAIQQSLPTPQCSGVNHADFSIDGKYAIFTCEFRGGGLIKVDIANRKIVGHLKLSRVTYAENLSNPEDGPPDSAFCGSGMPQDVRISPDGKVFYVADMMANGLWTVDGTAFKVTGLIQTGRGTHGLYVSRDSKTMYVSNRGEGTVTVFDFASRTERTKWKLPGGGSPDMGGVSADGKVLWLSGRYDSEVYAISTDDGRLLARIKVGSGPHGLCVYPQPGRYSLGHTGIFR
jgi:YVTN family beta-propeller protein